MIRGALRRLVTGATSLLPSPDPGRIVVICHCHHAELVSELERLLRGLPPGAALHVTFSDEAVRDRWRSIDTLPSRPLLHRVENRGRDIRPFFDIAGHLAIDPESLVLKIHGKRSGYSKHGTMWRRDLLGGLLPDRRAPGLVARRFRDNARLGIVGAPRSFLSHPVYWGGNRQAVARIMEGCFGVTPSEEDLGFFAGSMFWMRGALLRDLLPLVDLGAFEPEPLPQDGSYAHAIERIIGIATLHMGWEVGEIGDPAPLRRDGVRDRKIPYL